MKIFLSATELSADLHASYLIKAFQALEPEAQFCGILGAENESQEIWIHNRELNVMGFGDVVPKIPKILKMFSETAARIEKERPDAIILIDGPDFNLRLAKRIRKLGIPIFYYICPQVWAWRSSRIKTLKETCDYLIPILPFEEDFLPSSWGEDSLLRTPNLG